MQLRSETSPVDGFQFTSNVCIHTLFIAGIIMGNTSVVAYYLNYRVSTTLGGVWDETTVNIVYYR